MSKRIESWMAAGVFVAMVGSGCAMESAAPEATIAVPMMDLATTDRMPMAEVGSPSRVGGVVRGPRAAVNDSDRDGLSDAEETLTDPGAADSDEDGIGDAAEVLFAEACAVDPECTPPADFLGVVLTAPSELGEHAPEVAVDVRIGSRAPAADVFFLVDDSTAMAPALDRLRGALAQPWIADAILDAAPEARIGLGWQRDFPFAGRGSDGDAPFVLASALTETWERDVWPLLATHTTSDANDPDAAVFEALRQVLTGSGGIFTDGSGAMASMPAFAEACPMNTFGAACFRSSALPVIVHVSAAPQAERAVEGEAGLADLGAIFRMEGARYVGIDASGAACDAGVEQSCSDLRKIAVGAGSVDLAGLPVVGELDRDAYGEDLARSLAARITHAITHVPSHVEMRARGVGEGADLAAALIGAVGPKCDPGEMCWTAPEGIEDREAVRAVTGRDFAWVAPGTELDFSVAVRAEAVEHGTTSQRLEIELTSFSEGRPLETRILHVLVAAAP